MNNNSILLFLKICCVLIFLGRAYQHLFWDSPFRSLLWDQDLLESSVEYFLQMDWQNYVTNLKIDSLIQISIRVTGYLYLLCAIISGILSFKSPKWMQHIILIGGISLFILAILLTKEKFYNLAMFFEHSIQFGTPFILHYFVRNKEFNLLILPSKLLIALTFICHGVYALGTIYPLPANFVTMTMNILPINDTLSKNSLFIIGVLDIIFAIGLFIPKFFKASIIYCVIWGTLTAIARIYNGLYYGFSLSNIHQYLYLTIYRLPHGIFPLLLYLVWKKSDFKMYISRVSKT